MNRPRGRIWRVLKPSSLIAISVAFIVIGASIGVAFAITVAPQRPPSALKPNPAPTAYPVESERTRDDRDVQVRVERGDAQVVRTTANQGTVTASRCVPGSPIGSGSWTFAVDGVPRPNLGSSSPFWRDLKKGDAGDDVHAIQAELKRLGYQVRPDGYYGRETADALQQVLRRNEALPGTAKVRRDAVAEFRRSDWIWTPSATAIPSSCDVAVGTPVGENDALATLEANVRAVEVDAMPNDLIQGARTLTIGDETVPVDDKGVVPPEHTSLMQIKPDAGPPGPDASRGDSAPSSTTGNADGGQTLPAVLRLSEPLQIWSVPASLLFGFTENDSACLKTAKGVVPVQVVGSRLGSSLVLPRRGDIGATAYVPGRNERTCS